MNEMEFKIGMDTFDGRWERVSSKGKREVYFKSLHDMHSRGWFTIIDQAVDSFKMYPTPGELKVLYSQFLRDNPQLQNTDVIESECVHCEGYGFFTYLKHEETGIPYEFISKCPHCKNIGFTTGMTHKDGKWLRAKGFTVIPWIREPTAGKRPMIKDVSKLAKVATQQSEGMFKGEC